MPPRLRVRLAWKFCWPVSRQAQRYADCIGMGVQRDTESVTFAHSTAACQCSVSACLCSVRGSHRVHTSPHWSARRWETILSAAPVLCHRTMLVLFAEPIAHDAWHARRLVHARCEAGPRPVHARRTLVLRPCPKADLSLERPNGLLRDQMVQLRGAHILYAV